MKHIITLAQGDSERQLIISFINDVYQKVYGTHPGESDIYIVSKQDEVITGVIALDFCDTVGKMPIEYVYKIDWDEVLFPIHSHNAVQFGRWIAKDSRVSICLSYIATVYSLSLGKEYIWLVQTDAAHRILTRNGIVFYPLTKVKLLQENIPEGDLAYYVSSKCPKCYLSVAEQQKRALEEKSNEITRSGYVVFDKSLL
jgi:hypothetical protein